MNDNIVKAEMEEETGQTAGQTQQGVDINQTTAVNCVQCGGEFFKQSTLLRRVPADVAQNGQEQTVPVQVLRCEVCGRVV